MTYVYLKVAHILAMSFFFGAGAASAVLKLRADKSGDLQSMKFAAGHIVWADFLFTIPSGIALPVTGIWMALLAGYPLTEGWVAWGIGLYVAAGLFWLPAAFLQVLMHREIKSALSESRKISDSYALWSKIWMLLGVPSFAAALVTVYVMVSKHNLSLW